MTAVSARGGPSRSPCRPASTPAPGSSSSGEGEVGPGGGPAGDLYVEIDVARHPVFARDGDDLLCTITVPMTAAALGTTVELPTLEADVDRRRVDESTVERSIPLDIRPAPSRASGWSRARAASRGCAATVAAT